MSIMTEMGQQSKAELKKIVDALRKKREGDSSSKHLPVGMTEKGQQPQAELDKLVAAMKRRGKI